MATNYVSAANGFIDLATFSELESFMYGGPLAISWFVAGVQKANWFTIVPIQVRNNIKPALGTSQVSASLNRSADYILNLWFRCDIPTLAYSSALVAGNYVRWTRNLMHNLVKSVSISFNDLTVQTFDNYWLDFNYMFRCPASKRTGYKNMIGDISSLTTNIQASVAFVQANLAGGALFGGSYSLPLPFWFGEDSGIALPVAALPFNDVKVNFEFRSASELLVFQGPTGYNVSNLTAMTVTYSATAGNNTYTTLSTGSVDLQNGNTYAHYAVIHNDERTKMGDAPRDMLIRQTQPVSYSFVPKTTTDLTFDIRLSHSVVQFFFALANVTQTGEMSNYTTNIDYGTAQAAAAPAQGHTSQPAHWDPIAHTQIRYENTVRLDSDSDFYSNINPWFFQDAIPEDTGYHAWTYAIKPWDPVSPSGSTNFSKLANVSVTHTLSTRAQYWMTTGTFAAAGNSNLKLQNIFIAQNHNVARAANGSLGHPTM